MKEEDEECGFSRWLAAGIHAAEHEEHCQRDADGEFGQRRL
jgi:hypothetical protein